MSKLERPNLSFRLRLIAAFAAVYIIWGSTYLGIRFAIETLPPFAMAGTRMFVAGFALYGWARMHGTPRPTLLQWRSALVIGGLMLLIGNGGVVWAEQWVPSGLAALMVAMVPLWMVLFDWARGGVRPSVGLASRVALGFAGVALLMGPGDLVGGGHVDPVGAAVLMLSSAAWALGSLYSRKAPLPASSLLSTAAEMLAGGLLLWVAAVVTGEWGRVVLGEVSLRSSLALAYLIVFGSLIGFTAYIWLLKATTPARASTYAYVNPVVAMLLGWALAGEPLNGRTILAAAVIVVSVVLITTYRRQERAPGDDRPLVSGGISSGA